MSDLRDQIAEPCCDCCNVACTGPNGSTTRRPQPADGADVSTAEQRDIRIYRNARPWWNYPYTVIDGKWPTGPVISVAHTYRGALRRARRETKHPKPNNDYIQVWPQETT